MKIIKKKSPEVEALRGSITLPHKIEAITINRQEVYFSKAFVVLQDVKAGQFINFMNDEKDWRFYISDDKDGFLLKPLNRSRRGLFIQDGALVQLLRRSLELPTGKFKYAIQKTLTKVDGHPVYWILTKNKI